jgi:GTP cyclohydrolase I
VAGKPSQATARAVRLGPRLRARGSTGSARAGASGAAGAAVDSPRAEDAIARFLDALGLPPEVRRSADLAETPARVAEAWANDLLDGYREDPALLLAGPIPSKSRGLVAVTGIGFHSMCPHHLLPSRGVAHVAYLPDGRVVGFGQVVRLVDALAHRLVLLEDLAESIAGALVQHLGARGAGVVLDAEQACMTVRGERRSTSRTHAEAFAGALDRDGPARRRFLAAIGRSGSAPARRSRP